MHLDASKPVHQLTQADLQAHPVWRYLDDGDGPEQADESWVAPVASPPGRGDHGSFFIRSRFTLRNGRQLPGIVQLTVLGRHLMVEPACIHAHDKSIDVDAPDAARRLERLLQTPDAQPVRWELTLPLRGETQLRSGRVVQSRWLLALLLLARLIKLRLLR